MKTRNKRPDPGVLKKLEAGSVYVPKRPNKLRGFWKGVKSRCVFVPLGTYHAPK